MSYIVLLQNIFLGVEIKKCAAQSCAPKNTALIAATQLFYNPKRYAKNGHVFLPCKNAHHFGHSIKLCRKAIVSCGSENSNSLLNQADMTNEHEKCPPNSNGSAARSVLWGTGWKAPIFVLFTSMTSKKASAHPLHGIGDRRCVYVIEISANLCDAMISS